MSDGIVILGTIALVGLVAVVTISLVYNRSFWFRGNSSEVEIRTSEHVGADVDAINSLEVGDEIDRRTGESVLAARP